MMATFAAPLLLASAFLTSAAPIPKEGDNPIAGKLVGKWHYHSNDEVLQPWGTANVTFKADGKMMASFEAHFKNGLFADMEGTYRLRGKTLRVMCVQGKGTPDERKVDAVLIVTVIDDKYLRMVY